MWSYVGVYHYDVQKFVDASNDAHGLLLSSRLVQLACAVCVGW